MKALEKFAGSKSVVDVIKKGLGNASVNRNELAKKVFPEAKKGLHRLDKARLEAYRAKKSS